MNLIHNYWGYLATVQHWAGGHSHHHHMNNYWLTVCAPGIFFILIGAAIGGYMASESSKGLPEDQADMKILFGVVRGTVIVFAMMLSWVYIYWALLPLVILGLFVLTFCAFFDLIPSKAVRAEKAKTKVEELRAEVATNRSN